MYMYCRKQTIYDEFANIFLKEMKKKTVLFLGFINMNSFMEEAFLNIPW